MAKEYDVVILGGGTGGYVAAIRASQLGLKTAIVERDKLGGTCLHYGCIPTKSYLRSAEIYALTKNALDFGIETSPPTVLFNKVLERKNSIVSQLHQGVQGLMKKGKIDVYYGTGCILGPSIFSPMPGTISVEMVNGSENEMLLPTNVIIATGARPRHLDGIHVDGQTILDSNHMLELTELPKSITIVGGGVIGIEWASLLNDLGVNVTVIEAGSRIVPTEDEDICEELMKILTKKGIKIYTNALIDPLSIKQTSTELTINVEIEGDVKAFTSEKLLLSVGRVANVEGIGIENTDIVIENGVIQVNNNFQTAERHIYAIGDCIGGMQLAHVASHEGIQAVEHIAGNESMSIDYSKIARCIYSSPEVSSVGLTEKQAIDQGIQVKIGKFPFKAIGKALVKGDTEGFVKIIADGETDDVIGVHMIGPNVTELISEAGLALILNATPWEISKMIHPHPALSEVIGEAALAVDGKAIHF